MPKPALASSIGSAARRRTCGVPYAWAVGFPSTKCKRPPVAQRSSSSSYPLIVCFWRRTFRLRKASLSRQKSSWTRCNALVPSSTPYDSRRNLTINAVGCFHPSPSHSMLISRCILIVGDHTTSHHYSEGVRIWQKVCFPSLRQSTASYKF